MQKKIKFRKIRKKDFSTLQNLQELNSKDITSLWSIRDLENFLSKECSLGIIAELKENIIGFSLFSGNIDIFELYIIFVEPQYRKMGIAKKFLEKGINYCKKNKIKSIHLEVNRINNSAITLYDRFKFKKIGIRRNYYQINGQSFDALVMKLLI